MYGPIARGLGCTAVQIGTLTTWRGVVQAAMTPFVGSAGNALNRVILSAVGTVIWGVTSVGLGAAQSFAQAAAFASLNGVGLALVLPCVQSILADVYSPERRGLAFGLVLTTGAVGQIVFNYLAIDTGGQTIHGVPGWRMVFYIMAGVAGLTTVLTLLFGIEPRNIKAKDALEPEREKHRVAKLHIVKQVFGGVATMAQDCRKIFVVPSFVIILLGEIIMAIGGSGAGYQIMYFEITGFSATDTATMLIFFNVGNAIGMLTGGVLGDLFAKRFPRYARPFVNQLSMIIIAPLFFILYKGLPGSSRFSDGIPSHLHYSLPSYCALLFFMTIVAPWEQANNAAMFAEVIPDNLRSSAYAFDKGITGLLGALAAPLVGVLAQRVWGGRGLVNNSALPKDVDPSSARAQTLYARNVHNAMALENALLWLMIAAMLLRAAVYGALYFTLPRDARRVKENRAAPKPRDPEAELTGKRLLIKGEGSSGSSGSMGRAASFPPHKSKGIPATRHPSQPLPDSKLQS
ncbi:g2303 [Coccomyxa viridis]|uniref:G2303 protein n=1 Tax=Coccomyxa viridis TaxID=1274662 RepID=A0ABP1FK16_9CHLO